MFFEITPKALTLPSKRKNMILKRFGHCMVYLNGSCFVLGGFSHKDLPNEVPVTLASCEKYTTHDNTWAYISTMNEPRAFATCVTLENRYLYIMGGMHDFNVIQTIEKYDSISDAWLQVYFKLPMPLAKLGAVVVDNKSILVCGGMSSDCEPTRNVYSLDLSTVRWTKKTMMNHPRLTQQGLFCSNGFVFAIGGNAEAVCERYNVDTDKWVRIPNYNGRLEGESSLYYFAMCMMRS
jgi:Kelch motif